VTVPVDDFVSGLSPSETLGFSPPLTAGRRPSFIRGSDVARFSHATLAARTSATLPLPLLLLLLLSITTYPPDDTQGQPVFLCLKGSDGANP